MKIRLRYQLTEMGKIDAGGGGTIAYILANFGMEVIDGGVAVLSMHPLGKFQARQMYMKLTADTVHS